MRILLTGASGQLGTELIPRLSRIGNLQPVDLDCAACISDDCRPLDLADAGALETLLNRWQPDLVVNAAAYTAVDRAEEQPELAFAVNAEAPGRIARWCQRNDAFLLHYSTDYVFNGRTKRAYLETDTPDPLNTYGESKLAGERAIRASGCRFLIIRTSWVYSAHGHNFVLSMLRLAERQLKLDIVDDQVGCPTWARNLARVSTELLGDVRAQGWPRVTGLLHYSDADRVSWHDFAGRVFNTARDLELLSQTPELAAVDSSQYPQVAQRPAFSVLDTSAARAHGIVPARLDTSLRECLGELAHDRS